MAKVTKAKLLHAMKISWGEKTASAELLGVSRQAIYNFLDKNPTIAKEIDETVNQYIYDKVRLALETTGGNVKDTAELIGRGRDFVYSMMERYPALANIRTSAEDELLDVAERWVKRGIEMGIEKYVIFFLKTKGRRRGWITQNETVLKNNPNEPLEVVIRVRREEGKADE